MKSNSETLYAGGMNRYHKSEQIWEGRSHVLVNHVLTMSKSPLYICPRACPIYIDRAQGAYFWDVDGNRFIDYPLALGAIVLGHAYKKVDQAVRTQMEKGMLFSLSSERELELAELLIECIPCAEKVRLLKTGSEAMSAAVRIARAYTGREKIAVSGYHGWHDWTIARNARNAGVPKSLQELVFEFRFNAIDSLEQIFSTHQESIAAVALEPVAMSAPENNFLADVKELCVRNGALLLFDETITGFRLGLGGAQSCFSVTPDLAAFGKAMANGYPISALVGREDIINAVEEQIFISSTYGGDLLSIAAAIETISAIKENNVCDRLLELGCMLQEGLNALVERSSLPISCIGMPHKTSLKFCDHAGVPAKAMETFFRQECLSRGVFLGYGHFMSFSHTEEDIQVSLSVAEEVFEDMGSAFRDGTLMKRLRGEIAQDVFKRFQ